MLISRLGGDTSLRGTVQESELEQVWLDDIHDRILLLADGGGNRVQADRSATIFFDDGLEHSAIEIIQTKRINL